MKNIKQIRDLQETLAENIESNSEIRKLTTLVRSGLFDPSKLSMLKRALNKDNVKMSKVEREALLELLDKLLSVILSNQGTYTKVKQSISEDIDLEGYETLDESSMRPSNANMNIDITQIPAIIIMKRRGLRVFPDGQKVALYYADRINKYISVPFETIGIGQSIREEVTTDDDDKKFKAKLVTNKPSRINKSKGLSSAYSNYLDKQNDKTRQNANDLLATRKTSSFGLAKKAAGEVKKQTGSTAAALGTAVGGTIGMALHKKFVSGPKLQGIRDKVIAKRKTYDAKTPVTTNVKTPAGAETFKQNRTFEESYKLRLQKLREAREYGAADAALDAASFIPGPAGSAASLASAGMSLSRGDYVGAGLDALGAVPLVGYAAKGIKAARVASKVAKAAKVGKEIGTAEKVVKDVEKGAEVVGKDASKAKEAETAVKDTTPKQEPAKQPEKTTPEEKPQEPANKAKEGQAAAKPSRGKIWASRLGKAGKIAAGLAAAAGAAGSSGSGSGSEKVGQSSGQPAFGGKGIQGTNPFKTERPSMTSQDRRDITLNRKASQAMLKETKKTAFGGKGVSSTNPFANRKQSLSAQDRRDITLNRKASQAMVKESADSKFSALRTISETEDTYALQYEDGNVNVSGKMATKLMEVYNSLNADNKKVVQEMINKDKNSFMKFANFALGKQ